MLHLFYIYFLGWGGGGIFHQQNSTLHSIKDCFVSFSSGFVFIQEAYLCSPQIPTHKQFLIILLTKTLVCKIAA
jgi:hypothetical protein